MVNTNGWGGGNDYIPIYFCLFPQCVQKDVEFFMISSTGVQNKLHLRVQNLSNINLIIFYIVIEIILCY